ncbi:hypothetical protein CspeluHIS016_0106090 [Cutaneotrichosporon spelunceum]|uniref:Uncharacterized protein n=1 Tax=Cutaneotrichosporon spelunceum TaxID=1672016 RepID=A0AAD3Y9I5_9TREE|nr:hypothetical protein CspeluHIS016_0106090 [Cutaneotrichosporon spelunceum]
MITRASARIAPQLRGMAMAQRIRFNSNEAPKQQFPEPGSLPPKQTKEEKREGNILTGKIVMGLLTASTIAAYFKWGRGRGQTAAPSGR